MNLSRVIAIFLLMIGSFLAGCGGGGGNSSAANGGGASGDDGDTGGGTSVASKGTVDSFGSIFVNGVKFETGQAEIYLNGMSSTDNDLQLGMVVTVGGTISDDGLTGVASNVIFEADVEGPVSSIALGPDEDSLSIIIFNVEVLIENISTVVEGASFGSLAVGDFVEVSGFIDAQLRIRATRVVKVTDSPPGSGEAKLSGYVDALTGTQFTLQDVVVDFSNADLSELPDGELSAGMWVEVHGHIDNDQIAAERVAMEVGSSIVDIVNEGEDVSVEGTIFCSTTCNIRFTVDEFQVDATNAVFFPADLILQEGLVVQVDGVWSGHELGAQRILSRRGRIEIEAKVISSSAADGVVTLQLYGGAITVQVDERTLLEDNTGLTNTFVVGDISSGDFLQVEALKSERFLVATRIDRNAVNDDILQAPVESFNAGVDITLLGTTYTTEGARFEDQQDSVISSDVFYGDLRVGDLVKVLDERPTDGIADEVSFEHESLDGSEKIYHVETCPSDSESNCALITDTVFVDGKEWAQTDLFRGISWVEINAVCPAGICVESGALNGYDMTGWTWASTDEINALFNFYIGSEQLGPGPDSFSDMNEDFTTLFGWKFFYEKEEPTLQGGVWRSMIAPALRPALNIDSGVIRTDGLTSTPQQSLVVIEFGVSVDETPYTSVTTGMEYQDDDSCGWLCIFPPRSFQGAWFFRNP